MGYNTRYEFTYIPDSSEESFYEHLWDITGGKMDLDDEWKWYSHENDIAKAMILSMTDKVSLHGEGEDRGDTWDKEFRRARELGDEVVLVTTFKYDMVRRDEGIESVLAYVPESKK